MSGQADVAHTAASYSDQEIDGYELLSVATVDNRGFNLPCTEPEEKDGIRAEAEYTCLCEIAIPGYVKQRE